MMAFTAGTRVGPYEILSVLGAGGMGEVYRARDARLNRDVALKVLSAGVANDPDRLRRFGREAQVLASLNHQNIAQVYGFEETGERCALVMELVDGSTLADRIRRGPVPLEEALAVARQIACALEAAHDRSIIHRDLKPANVKVRLDGTVKVLDFGLAKAMDQRSGAEDEATRREVAESPTMTAATTMPGLILGTAAYMPPEQAKGQDVDRRADIWAFGCVLFEMLTGRRPFEGSTVSDVLRRIAESEPDWHALPATTPRSIRTLLRRCLIKDPRRRLDSAAAAGLEIDETLNPPAASDLSVSDVERSGRTVSRSPWGKIAVLVLAAGVVALVTWAVTRPASAPPAQITRFAITLPAAAPIAFSINDRDLALSADGSRLAYVAGNEAQLMVRALDQLEAVPLAGLVNARAPFFSPDGHWIGFFDRLDEGVTTGPVVQHGALRKVSTSGGPAIKISELTGGSRGASWSADDSIVFATSDTSTGLLRVRAGGGEVEVLTQPDLAAGERDHYFPSVLPGGRGVLFTVRGEGGLRQVAVLDLATGERKTLIRSGGQAEYVDTRHLIYEDDGALYAVPFDLAALEVLGDPVPLIERVLTLGATEFSVSRRGTLVYVPVNQNQSRSLVWVTRRGTEEPISAPPRAYRVPRLSPDGKRVALEILEQSRQLWTWDFARAQFTRLTFDVHAVTSFFLWTPDGRRIIYGSTRDAPVSNLYRLPADGTGTEERLMAGAVSQARPTAIAPDGARLVFETQTAAGDYDFMLLALDGTQRVEPLLRTPFDERNATISPDGRWMAYESNDSGQSQIYVRPFPNVADTLYQVSQGGGRTPAWAPGGRELFFVNGASIMAVAVELTPTFNAGNPTKLFETRSLLLDGRLLLYTSGSLPTRHAGVTQRTYDISPDGQRFLMIKNQVRADDRSAPPSMIVVQNWFEELKAKVPH